MVGMSGAEVGKCLILVIPERENENIRVSGQYTWREAVVVGLGLSVRNVSSI